mmetsp:Transcript_43892/g.125589  ORF Transcript_43892/g.125589 Transcript_43892/m.125589 type:complete len:188 (-) Transcript_43892:42-605(-)
MDAYSISKRNADPILRLGMDQGISAKLQSFQGQQSEMLRSQGASARELHQKLGDHIIHHGSKQRSLEKHMVSSKLSFSSLSSSHVHPHPDHHRQVMQHVQGMQRTSSDILAVQQESAKYQQRLRSQSTRQLETQATSMSAWFAKYGEPKRQSSSGDLHLSFVMKPRWCPHTQTFKNAQALRRGHITK